MFKTTLRNTRLSIGKLLIDCKPESNKVGIDRIKKIIFIRYDGKIGDYIVSSFVYDQIKKQNPAIQIDIVAAKANGSVIEKDKNIDNLVIIKSKSYVSRIGMALQLRKHRYDVLFDATPGSLRNRDLLFIRLVKASINIGYAKEKYHLFNLNLPAQALPTAIIYQQMMRLLGFESKNIQYLIPENTKASKETDVFLQTLSGKKIIAVNLLGASRSRKFVKENAIVLLKNVLAVYPDYAIVLLTYPQVNSWMKEIMDSLESKQIFSFLGTTSIFHTISIIQKSALVITPDTVAVHIADTYHKPLIAFYSMEKENFVHWKSLQADAVILRYQDNINQVTQEQFEDALKQALVITNFK